MHTKTSPIVQFFLLTIASIRKIQRVLLHTQSESSFASTIIQCILDRSPRRHSACTPHRRIQYPPPLAIVMLLLRLLLLPPMRIIIRMRGCHRHHHRVRLLRVAPYHPPSNDFPMSKYEPFLNVCITIHLLHPICILPLSPSDPMDYDYPRLRTNLKVIIENTERVQIWQNSNVF
jgi:hypothetical protein